MDNTAIQRLIDTNWNRQRRHGAPFVDPMLEIIDLRIAQAMIRRMILESSGG